MVELVKFNHSIASICLLAGKLMLENGAETNRVEDTMNRIAQSFGLQHAQSYATPTVIHFSSELENVSVFIRIDQRTNDLHKIDEVNRISRAIAAGELSRFEALQVLQALEKQKLTFPYWLQTIAAALVSGAFAIMFGGAWSDFLPAFLAGGIGYVGMLGFLHLVEMRFIADFFASVFIGVSALVFVHHGFGAHLDKVIIGAVMPLVPGLHITNAVRELMAGHLVSGLSKGAEAVLTAFAIGAGVAIAFAFV